MKEFKALNVNDFKLTRLNKGHFGGGKFICTHIEDKTKYVLKPHNMGQTLNEIVAQHFLYACGFNSIPTNMMIYKDGNVYGVTKYLNELKRIYSYNLKELTSYQREILVKLYFINDILNNLDEGEFFIDDKGDIYSLDYGESIVTCGFLDYRIYEQDKDDRMKDYAKKFIETQYTSNALFKDIDNAMFRFKEITDDVNGYFSHIEFDVIIGEVLCCIADIDKSKFNELFEFIEKYHGPTIRSLYKTWLDSIVGACKELCNNNCELVFN